MVLSSTDNLPGGRRGRRLRDERGQILVLVGLTAVALFAIIGIAVDVGRVFVTRAQLSRAVDAAALSGVLDLPSISTAQATAMSYIAENEPTASASVNANCGDNCLHVTASKDVGMYFLRVIGIGSVTVNAAAKAGFGIQPIDVYLSIDATGSMGTNPPCNSNDNNAGCPIWEAKNAAKAFVDTLIGATPSGYTLIGTGPFRGCYRPPKPAASSICVDVATQVTNLTSNKTTLNNGINAINAIGGSGTNICNGMIQGQTVLYGPGSHTQANTRRYLVILSDGDNTYNNYSYQASPASPPGLCRPNTSPQNSDGNVSSNCLGAQTREREIDTKTYSFANTLKGLNVEIYIVGFGVCGATNATVFTPAQCSSQIGNADHDNTADRRLNKCLASSTTGTNDHYFEAATAADLPAIFTQIAQQIAHRLIE